MPESEKIKAETFDIMQYFYGIAHHPLIHCLIHFSAYIDEKALKKAVMLSLNTVPIIGCCFDISSGKPVWESRGFTGEDIVHIVKTGSEEPGLEKKLLASDIDAACGPQLKIYIIRHEKHDTLCIIINHMVCDGAGFKEYLYLLSNLYTQCTNNLEHIEVPESYQRSTAPLFDSFNLHGKLKILSSKYDIPKQKSKSGYYLHGNEDNPFFVTTGISAEQLESIKEYAKKHGASVNDMIVTAYVRTLRKALGKDNIVIPCPVDLRKYVTCGKKLGITNLTSNYICDVTICEKDTFKDTLMKVSGQMKAQKSGTNCLKPVMLLEFAFHALPFKTMQKVFHKVFTIPVISYTNFGIIDEKMLSFGCIPISDIYMTGAIKHVPYLQIAVSTFDDNCTLSCNLYGTSQDKIKIEELLENIKKEFIF